MTTTNVSYQILPTSHADGEWSSRTSMQEGLWIGCDVIGTARNVAGSLEAGSQIAGTSAKMATVCGGILVPIGFVLAGGLVCVSAIKHMIPNAHKEYSGASQEMNLILSNHRAPDYKQKFHYAEEGMTVAKLGLANQYLYGAMGAGLTATGVVTALSPTSASLFGFSPVVSSSAAINAGGALGAIYVVRGGIIIGRSIYNLRYLNKFQKEFRNALRVENETPIALENAVTKAIQVTDAIGQGSNALKRRMGEKVEPLRMGATLDEKIHYLQAVDKGIHEKKLQQKIALIIGISMFLGGLAAIAATIFTGGLALPIIALISGIAFTLMEGIWATYDSSRVFEWMRGKLYTPSDEIKQLMALRARLGSQLEAQAVQPQPRSFNDSVNDVIRRVIDEVA